MLKGRFITMINELYDDEEFYFQQDRAPPRYETKELLNDSSFSVKWIKRKDVIDWSARSPDLTPDPPENCHLNFFLKQGDHDDAREITAVWC